MVWALLALLSGCTCTPSAAPPAASAGSGEIEQLGAAPVPAASGLLVGVCEASTIVPWDGGWLVGDNEDSGRLHAFGPDFSPRGPVPLPAEVDDIEALALAGSRYWVIGSHSTNKDGEPRPTRERILAPTGQLAPLTLAACPTCVAARGRAPDAGGFNIEGAAVWGGQLWLGLRAPLTAAGQAQLLGLDSAGAAVETLALDLGGLAVREMIPDGDGLLLVAGPSADADVAHALYRLGPDRALTRLAAQLPPSTEGIALDPANPGTLVYVTDGDGKPGKKCRQPATWGRIALP